MNFLFEILFIILFLFVLILIFGLLLNIFSDPNFKYSFATKIFFKTTYNKIEGFKIQQINKPKLFNNFFSKILCQVIQLTNFLLNKNKKNNEIVIKNTYNFSINQNNEDKINKIYNDIVNYRFKPERIIYLTTGAPHSRAFYLRNFGVFYIDILNPDVALDENDYINRIKITFNSISFMLSLFYGKKSLTTTVIPLGFNFYGGINYYNKPSDSLLGILSALDMLINPSNYNFSNKYDIVQKHAKNLALKIVNDYKNDLKEKLDFIIENLKIYKKTGLPMLDRDKAYSSALDTRIEKRRFIVSANTYLTFKKALDLEIISDKYIEEKLNMSLKTYKNLILDTFGKNGYIQNSLSKFKKKDFAKNIVIDFLSTKNGFWNLENKNEFFLLKNTIDIIINDKRFYSKYNNLIILSIKNPKVKWYNKIAASAYHGKTIWIHFVLEFIYFLLKIYDKINDKKYLNLAKKMLDDINNIFIYFNGYPEVLNYKKNKLYKTFVYKSAMANTWISRYKSILIDFDKYFNHNKNLS